MNSLTQAPEVQIQAPEVQIQAPEVQIQTPEVQIQAPEVLNCQKHNEPITFYYSNPTKKACCQICMEEKTGMISAQSYLQKLNAIVQQETELYHNDNQILQDWYHQIQSYKKSLNASLDWILKFIADQMKIIRENKEELQQLKQLSTDHQKTVADIERKSEITEKQIQQVKNKVKEQLSDFKNKYLKYADKLLNQLIGGEKVNCKYHQIEKRNLEFELVQTCSKKEENTCFAFAFNKESNILVVACEKEIIIYQFNKVIVKEIQRLKDHTSSVYCLYFMKQSNSFVSGSDDRQIIIWEFDQNKMKWFAKYIMNDHEDSVHCILMNKQEDLLISGSQDQTLRFWEKNDSNWSIQQTLEAEGEVYDISLNQNENKLLSWVCEQILIIYKTNDSIWRIIQTININCCRLCFTVGDQFIFQPLETDKMEVYDFDHDKKQFEQLQLVQTCKFEHDDFIFFPCQYIQKLKIITAKHHKHLNVFKINSNGKYQLIKTLEFDTDEFYGKLSDDGDYLVTWDTASEQIQVSNLKFIE